MVRAGSRNKTEKRIVRAGYGKEMGFTGWSKFYFNFFSNNRNN